MEVMMDIQVSSVDRTAQPAAANAPQSPFHGVLAAALADDTAQPVSDQTSLRELTGPVEPQRQSTAADTLAAALAALTAAPVSDPAALSEPGLEPEPEAEPELGLDPIVPTPAVDDSAVVPEDAPRSGGVWARVRAGWEFAPGHVRRQSSDGEPDSVVKTRPSQISSIGRELVEARNPAAANRAARTPGPLPAEPSGGGQEGLAVLSVVRAEETGTDVFAGPTAARPVTMGVPDGVTPAAPVITANTSSVPVPDHPAAVRSQTLTDTAQKASVEPGHSPATAPQVVADPTPPGEGLDTTAAVTAAPDTAPVSTPAGQQGSQDAAAEQGQDEQQTPPVGTPVEGRDQTTETQPGVQGAGRARQGSPANRVDPQPDHGADAVRCAANNPVRPEPHMSTETISVREPVSIERLPGELIRVAGSVQSGGRAEVELRLDPPELGAVTVRMTSEAGRLKAEITVATTAARQLVSDEIPRLRVDLATAGYEVGDVTVSLDNKGRQPEGNRQRFDGGGGPVRAASASAAYNRARILRPDSSFEFVA